MVTEIPSLTLLDAWLLPWDYAMDMCDAIARRARRSAAGAAASSTSAPTSVKCRKMSDGKREHAAGVTQLLSLFGV